MIATFQIEDYIFSYQKIGKEPGISWVDKVQPHFIVYNAKFNVESGSFISAEADLSQGEIDNIQKLIRENKSRFNLTKQKSYLRRGPHIKSVSKEKFSRIKRSMFLDEPDFQTESKLWLYLMDSHCLLDFDRNFIREGLRISNQRRDLLEEVENSRKDFLNEPHFSMGNKGWDLLPYPIVEIYEIEELEGFYIVGSQANYTYVREQNGSYAEVNMPGEFVGTGDFLWVQ